MTAPRFQFSVLGIPAGQGNLSGTRHGKLRHANGDELYTWRAKVRQAAIDHVGGHEWRGEKPKAPCLDCGVRQQLHAELMGVVRLEAIITVPKPASVESNWPITRSSSDWDHYARAIGDSLTGVIFRDDSQVIDGAAIKTFPGVHPHSLGSPGAVVRVWSIDEDKSCTRCENHQPRSAFSRDCNSIDGLQYVCKTCQSELSKVYRAATVEQARARGKRWYELNKKRANAKNRASHLRRKFGITPEQYDEMLAAQGGGCAICGLPRDHWRSLAVDHSHATGEVRGILCNRCNRMLGLAFDDPDVLEQAAKYLRR